MTDKNDDKRMGDPESLYVAFTDKALYSPGGLAWRITIRATAADTPASFIDRLARLEEELSVRGFSERKPKKVEQARNAPPRQEQVEGGPPPAKKDSQLSLPVSNVKHAVVDGEETLLLLNDDGQVAALNFDGILGYIAQTLGEGKRQALLDALWTGERVPVRWLAWFKPGEPKPRRIDFVDFMPAVPPEQLGGENGDA